MKKTVLFLGLTIEETAKAISLVTSCQESDLGFDNSRPEGVEKILEHLEAHPAQYGEVIKTTTVLELKDRMTFADVIWIVNPAGSLRLTATKDELTESTTEGDEDQMPGHDEPCPTCGKKAGLDALIVTGSSMGCWYILPSPWSRNGKWQV